LIIDKNNEEKKYPSLNSLFKNNINNKTLKNDQKGDDKRPSVKLPTLQNIIETNSNEDSKGKVRASVTPVGQDGKIIA
jgi:hypothetical protein